MGETKVNNNMIQDGAIDSNKLAPNSISSTNITDGSIVNADISPSAAITVSKLSTPGGANDFLKGDGSFGAVDTTAIATNAFNIGVLGFKMAVNDGLTVYNLIDGVVDEFNDETGIDTGENSNAIYDSTSDFYSNQVAGTIPAPQQGRQVLSGHTFANQGEGTYNVEPTVTAVDLLIVGGGGGGYFYYPQQGTSGAGGGGLIYVKDYEVTPGSSISYIIGSGGEGHGATPSVQYYAPTPNFPPSQTSPYPSAGYDGSGKTDGPHAFLYEAGGDAPFAPQIAPYVGGGVWNVPSTQVGSPPGPSSFSTAGYGGTEPNNPHPNNIHMGHGRDTIWNDGQPDAATTTDESPTSRTYFSKLTGMGGGRSRGYADARNNFGGCGGGGSTLGHGSNYGPLVGGEGIQSVVYPAGPGITPGAPEEGDMPSLTGNVVGSFGADGGNGEGPPPNSQNAAGGGGSGEAGTSGAAGAGGDGLIFTLADGSTPIAYGAGGGGGEGGEGGNEGANGGDGSEPAHAGTAGRGNGAGGTMSTTEYGSMGMPGGSGTIVVVETRQLATNSSMTLISDTFTANTTPSTARLVVFADISDDLNTDFSASVTRDNTNFDAVTLTDEGYAAGSSGIKIFTGSTPLTGAAPGQPQVQLRWKIVGSSMTGANKIHGVALQWA